METLPSGSGRSSAEPSDQPVYDVPCIGADYKAHIRPMLDLVDNLRGLGIDRDISLPSIVVVGDQSAGKSSVLEALSGVQLPRGTGIVTRCPLEMRLKSSKDGWDCSVGYRRNGSAGRQGSLIQESISQQNQVSDKILEVQTVLADKKEVSNSLIHLEIKSPDVPDLTLIDLPGIVRVPVDGQQDDAVSIIRETIESYIKRDATIILCVIPANVDIATSEALQMAKKVDPTMCRTIGVITKPDMIGSGNEEELVNVVTNKKYCLKLGYTLVKCRCQEEVKKDLSPREVLENEQRYFQDASYLRHVPETLLGIKNLSKRLHEVLVHHIKKQLPDITRRIVEMRVPLETEIEQLGPGLPEDSNKLKLLLFQVVTMFTDAIKAVVKGLGVLEIGTNIYPDLNAYRKIKPFLGGYRKNVEELKPEKSEEFETMLRKTADLHRGKELVKFWSYPVFEDVIKDFVLKSKHPARQCLTESARQVDEIFHRIVEITLGQYHVLEKCVQDGVSKQIIDTRKKCEKELEKYFSMELLVYTGEEFFTSKDAEVEISTTSDSVEDPSVMSDAVRGYLGVCIGRIADMVPMTIIHYMIKSLAENIEKDVHKLLVQDDNNMIGLLTEQEDIAEKRTTLYRKLERLTKAEEHMRIYSGQSV